MYLIVRCVSLIIVIGAIWSNGEGLEFLSGPFHSIAQGAGSSRAVGAAEIIFVDPTIDVSDDVGRPEDLAPQSGMISVRVEWRLVPSPDARATSAVAHMCAGGCGARFVGSCAASTLFRGLLLATLRILLCEQINGRG